MFYNNKGANAIIKKEFTTAYAFLRKAINTDPQLVEAMTNMGVLYSRSGKTEYAEGVYKTVLSIDHQESSTQENLAHIYSITGRKEQADRILARLKEQRKDNPNYNFILGEIEFEKQNLVQAIKYYKKAISLDKKKHHYYFALAKVYHQQGNIKRSKKYLKLAKKYTPTQRQQQLYQGKLDLLSNL